MICEGTIGTKNPSYNAQHEVKQTNKIPVWLNKTEKEHLWKCWKKTAMRHKAKFHNDFMIEVFFPRITQCVLFFYGYTVLLSIVLFAAHKESSALTENTGQ